MWMILMLLLLLFLPLFNTIDMMNELEARQYREFNWPVHGSETSCIQKGSLSRSAIFFKHPTTNQYMNHGQSYPERTMKWEKCSMMGWFLIRCYYFSSSWQLISTWISKNCISRIGIPLWEGFLIGCYSFPNIDN